MTTEEMAIAALKTLPISKQQIVLDLIESLRREAQKGQVVNQSNHDENGWGVGFFDRTAGALAVDPLIRYPQGELEFREILE